MADIEVIDGESVNLFVEEYGIQVPNAEEVFQTTSANINRFNGGIQVLTLEADDTLSTNLTSGQSVTLMVQTGTYKLDVSGYVLEASFILEEDKVNMLCVFNVLGTNYITFAGSFPVQNQAPVGEV